MFTVVGFVLVAVLIWWGTRMDQEDRAEFWLSIVLFLSAVVIMLGIIVDLGIERGPLTLGLDSGGGSERVRPFSFLDRDPNAWDEGSHATRPGHVGAGPVGFLLLATPFRFPFAAVPLAEARLSEVPAAARFVARVARLFAALPAAARLAAPGVAAAIYSWLAL